MPIKGRSAKEGRLFIPVATLLAVVLGLSLALASPQQKESGLPQSGKKLYQEACAACHGVDGTGAPASTLGFDVPPPDFTDCNFATREADLDWITVADKGGPARGFSDLMPAFGKALSKAQMQKIMDHIRTFCGDTDWPRGELNLPRPLVTTKAYPEDELVLSTTVNTEGLNRIASELIYEQRFGVRNQLELVLPFGWTELETSDGDVEWRSSVGDIGLGAKRVLFHSLDSGSIVSLGGEVFLPTGDEEEGFGTGTTVVEPYLSYGQILPAELFLQLQGGFGLPLDTDKANEEAFWRGVAGRSFYTGEYGRTWSPMVELLGSRELVSGADTNWDVAPQLQVTLNDRQHVRLGFGARIPINNTDVRETEYIVYVLWDWFDGGFFAGW